jgi:hypothetical protein
MGLPTTISLSRQFLNVSSFSVIAGTFLGHLINSKPGNTSNDYYSYPIV